MHAPQGHRLKSIGKLIAVAVGFSLIVVFAAEAPKASAPAATGAQVQRLAKSDRLPVFVKGTACSLRGWPNYEQSCLFYQRGSAADVRTVRVVGIERRDRQSDAPVIKVLALR
jgi:hypothetical protein